MTSAFSWQSSVNLSPASFCTLKAKLGCYSRYLFTSSFCIPVPYDEKNIFFLVLVLGGHVGLHRIVQLHFLQRNCDVEWFAMKMNRDQSAMKMNRDQSVIFEIVPKYCILDSFVNYEGCSTPSKGFLLTVVK